MWWQGYLGYLEGFVFFPKNQSWMAYKGSMFAQGEAGTQRKKWYFHV
jgi:hypothetical protein